METLYEKLNTYGHSDYYPFHMPGHKRQPIWDNDNSYFIDITEIDGFDDLHHPEGILQNAMERAAKCYKADNSFFLVNGSTCGILAAISAVTKLGDTIGVARNCHKSVYHAMALRNLRGVYVYPDVMDIMNVCGQVNPKMVQQMLSASNGKITAFVMVSPTYEGVVSDIARIADMVHQYKIPLIVDEAHGAHFCFHREFPKSALELGADIVIQSLHKTLPCMTQTAMLHWKAQPWNKNPEQMLGAIEEYLSIYQTSSPSYVLMASMDKGLSWMQQEGKGQMETYVKELLYFREQCKQLRYIHLLEPEDLTCVFQEDIEKNIRENSWKNDVEEKQHLWYDKSKLVFGTGLKGYSGKWLYESLLNDFHLQMEMCTPDYCLAMTSVMDSPQGFQRLYEALRQLDERLLGLEESCEEASKYAPVPWAQPFMSWYEVMGRQTKKCKLVHALNWLAAKPIYLYPPGIPIVLPGELLTEEMIRLICHYKQEGFLLRGMEDEAGEYIAVVGER